MCSGELGIPRPGGQRSDSSLRNNVAADVAADIAALLRSYVAARGATLPRMTVRAVLRRTRRCSDGRKPGTNLERGKTG